MANNHQGSVEHGINIIRAYSKIRNKFKSNFDFYFKLQFRDMNSFISPNAIKENKNKHIPRFLSTKLSDKKFNLLINEIKRQKFKLIITPFDEKSISKIVKKIDYIKIASCSSNDWPLLEKIAETKKPVICSLGSRSYDEIDNLYSFFSKRVKELSFLHCVGIYPTPDKNMNISTIDKLIKRYNKITIGYSGHEKPDDILPSVLALSSGAKIFERHVGLETENISLNKYSMNPDQTIAWLTSLHKAYLQLGNKKRIISKKELQSLNDLARGVYAKKNIIKGDILSSTNTYFAFPKKANQLSSGQFKKNLTASKNYKKNQEILESVENTELSTIRKYIKRYKHFFIESGIILPNANYNIELSYHYGIGKISKFGACLINIINRDFCKKYIILLPGQTHPLQKHIKKEEYFTVLHGDTNIIKDNNRHHLNIGDCLLIKRNEWHEFSSKNGVIIEELSTTSLRNDSFYKDPIIANKDPLERKTLFENW